MASQKPAAPKPGTWEALNGETLSTDFNQWPNLRLSSYGPVREQVSIISGIDTSPEELHCYALDELMAAGKVQNFHANLQSEIEKASFSLGQIRNQSPQAIIQQLQSSRIEHVALGGSLPDIPPGPHSAKKTTSFNSANVGFMKPGYVPGSFGNPFEILNRPELQLGSDAPKNFTQPTKLFGSDSQLMKDGPKSFSQFGGSSSQPAFATSQPGFGNTQPAFATSQSGFGNTQPAFAASQSGFGNTQAASTPSQSGFGNTQTTSTPPQSGFGNTPTTSATSQPSFSNSPSGFASPQPVATQTSGFGESKPAASSGSGFGGFSSSNIGFGSKTSSSGFGQAANIGFGNLSSASSNPFGGFGQASSTPVSSSTGFSFAAGLKALGKMPSDSKPQDAKNTVPPSTSAAQPKPQQPASSSFSTPSFGSSKTTVPNSNVNSSTPFSSGQAKEAQPESKPSVPSFGKPKDPEPPKKEDNGPSFSFKSAFTSPGPTASKSGSTPNTADSDKKPSNESSEFTKTFTTEHGTASFRRVPNNTSDKPTDPTSSQSSDKPGSTSQTKPDVKVNVPTLSKEESELIEELKRFHTYEKEFSNLSLDALVGQLDTLMDTLRITPEIRTYPSGDLPFPTPFSANKISLKDHPEFANLPPFPPSRDPKHSVDGLGTSSAYSAPESLDNWELEAYQSSEFVHGAIPGRPPTVDLLFRK